MLESQAEIGMTAPRARSGGRGWPLWLAAGLLLLYVAAIAVLQVGVVLDPDSFHEEVRSLFRYHRIGDAQLFAGDYLTGFTDAFARPLLYEAVTRLWIGAGGDLLILHRGFTLICWLAFLVALVLTARRLRGWEAAVAVLGIAVAQPVYLFQIASALPHAFAFPLLAWGLFAALAGSTLWLAAVVILGGLLYPVVTPLLGLLLVWLAFVGEGKPRGRAGWAKAAVLVGLTGLAALWLLRGVLVSPHNLGPALQPLEAAARFPENGAEGRHFDGVLHPLRYVITKVGLQFRDELGTGWLAFLLAYALVAFYGFAALVLRDRAGKALVAFVVICALFCGTALWLRPFHAYRFLLYPAMTVMPLLFVLGALGIGRSFGLGRRGAAALALGAAAAIVLASDSLSARKLGYWWRLDEADRRVMAFAAATPPQSLFAVWPDTESSLELLPYIARRPLLVMEKLHYPSFESHVLAMRARMNALIDAYHATGATGTAPLRSLHCRWGVDFLVVETGHFAEDGPRPGYFAPFAARLEALWRRHDPADFLLQAPPAGWVALETARHRVVDLAAVAPDCPDQPPAN